MSDRFYTVELSVVIKDGYEPEDSADVVGVFRHGEATFVTVYPSSNLSDYVLIGETVAEWLTSEISKEES